MAQWPNPSNLIRVMPAKGRKPISATFARLYPVAFEAVRVSVFYEQGQGREERT